MLSGCVKLRIEQVLPDIDQRIWGWMGWSGDQARLGTFWEPHTSFKGHWRNCPFPLLPISPSLADSAREGMDKVWLVVLQ
jgi:hypothetical protein